MAIVGHGVDLVPVERIAHMRARHGQRFLERVYTADERDYAAGRPRRTDEHLAARFAAKEAVLKALGTGLTGGVRWTDIGVVRDASGRPSVILEGEARVAAERLGARRWTLSLTHAGGFAAASVLAEDGPTGGPGAAQAAAALDPPPA